MSGLTTKEKALQINLDDKIYGSFAEIGAGQEVAANFFKAGGASGTIAKTISAYDMSFSDAIYGKCERYVCEPRLIRMLDREFDLLNKRLGHRALSTRFFAFANTVEALNYQKSNQPHGWIGIRFQLQPEAEYNQCIVHLHMLDNEAIWQQQALGDLGVNLIYGCYHYTDPSELLTSLMDGLNPGRIEIDMFQISGPDFNDVDNRLLSLQLVKGGMTKAAMFGPDGHALQPSEVLHKKNALVLRGRFRPVTRVNVDMLLSSRRIFLNEPDVDKENVMVITELTLQDLSTGGKFDQIDYLNRVDILCSLGQTVMISNYYRYYKLVNYLSMHTRKKKIGIILGFNNLQKIFDESYYGDLRGGILEAFGSLFGHNVKLFVYPSKDAETGTVNTMESLDLPKHLHGLFQYLKDNNKLEDVKGADHDLLDIISDDVLEQIRNGQPGWEPKVPTKVASTIKERKFFNYKEAKTTTDLKKVAQKAS